MLWTTKRGPVALAALLAAGAATGQQLDICGCALDPDSLGDFDTAGEASYPAGTVRTGGAIALPASPDGAYVFDSFLTRFIPGAGNPTVVFSRNQANLPITLLVKGDMTLESGSALRVDGVRGTNGSSGAAGSGGLGGPGGFRGGDGASQSLNGAADGGFGFGPRGGAGGEGQSLAPGAPGTFAGSGDLLPMVGGSGGGGGASASIDPTSCSGGGGGGGGGGLLVAVNGTLDIAGNVTANGATGGSRGNAACASSGGGGSGGAIRLLAETIQGGGRVQAAGGFGAGPGAIRMEAFTIDFPGTRANPPATRALAPGPVVPPLPQGVAITSVAGETLSRVNGLPLAQAPQGYRGDVDVLLAAAGLVDIGLGTTGIPAGTAVAVTLKPRLDAVPAVENVPLEPGACDAAGDCSATLTVDLPAGGFVIEARATFAP